MPIQPALTVFDDSILSFLNPDFEIKTLDTTCRFSEGPVWNSDGFYLFSDIPANVIYKIADGKKKEVYLAESGWTPGNTRVLAEQIGSNGLAYDSAGNLFICQHGNGAVARYDGTFLKPHVAAFNGKPFNSPNDLVLHPDGSLFFSDPPYGLKDQKLDVEKYQPVAGFYCYRDGVLKMFTDRYKYPNGLCLSPDNKSLYTVSNKPSEAAVLEWDVATLELKREVAAENGDGIKCDRAGNLYLCNKDGLLILNSAGKRLALIALPTVPANCCWGGETGLDMLVTARENIFLLTNLQKA
ncbi:MAG TPA: SMP-30/gluconolactonase/LRE family protein [Chitinophagaceae bacterium]|nr:SMP-30/gluconolactonase/LRE family protein [Chitinophagaceae bacterium]